MDLSELRRYDWCTFYDCQTNIKEKKSGAKIGKYLACSGYESKWKIYQVYGGLPVIDVWITSLADAVRIAQEIAREYSEYLPIYESWPDCDLLGIARLSVPGGDKIHNVLTELEKLNRPISYQDFDKILKEK